MLTKLFLGNLVIYNDHSGFPCPAIVTKIYTPNDPNSDLDLHVIGVKGNASYARGKLRVTFGTSTGQWEHSPQRLVTVEDSDLPIDEDGLLYDASNDQFQTEPVGVDTLTCIDGGTF